MDGTTRCSIEIGLHQELVSERNKKYLYDAMIEDCGVDESNQPIYLLHALRNAKDTKGNNLFNRTSSLENDREIADFLCNNCEDWFFRTPKGVKTKRNIRMLYRILSDPKACEELSKDKSKIAEMMNREVVKDIVEPAEYTYTDENGKSKRKSLVLIALDAKYSSKGVVSKLFKSAKAAVDYLCNLYKKGYLSTEESIQRVGCILSNNPEKIDEMMNSSDDCQANSGASVPVQIRRWDDANVNSANGGKNA